ncbi:MAG: hypothetical protein QW244_01150 [Candidatus Pacearchaeota archaeon]
MIFVFKSGKSKGMSLEQLAVNDYPMFVWLRKNATKLPKNWLDRMDEIILALDNFESKINCIVCKDKPIRLLSIATYLGYYGKITDISISTAFGYCSKECAYNDGNATALFENKASLYKIKYSEIFSIFSRMSCTKQVSDEIHDVMYKLLAGEMRKTKENLYDLINSILESRKKRYEQLNFNY